MVTRGGYTTPVGGRRCNRTNCARPDPAAAGRSRHKSNYGPDHRPAEYDVRLDLRQQFIRSVIRGHTAPVSKFCAAFPAGCPRNPPESNPSRTVCFDRPGKSTPRIRGGSPRIRCQRTPSLGALLCGRLPKVKADSRTQPGPGGGTPAQVNRALGGPVRPRVVPCPIPLRAPHRPLNHATQPPVVETVVVGPSWAPRRVRARARRSTNRQYERT